MFDRYENPIVPGIYSVTNNVGDLLRMQARVLYVCTPEDGRRKRITVVGYIFNEHGAEWAAAWSEDGTGCSALGSWNLCKLLTKI